MQDRSTELFKLQRDMSMDDWEKTLGTKMQNQLLPAVVRMENKEWQVIFLQQVSSFFFMCGQFIHYSTNCKIMFLI